MQWRVIQVSRGSVVVGDCRKVATKPVRIRFCSVARVGSGMVPVKPPIGTTSRPLAVDLLTTGSPPQTDAQLRGYGWRRRGDREVKISSAVSPLAWTMGIRAASARAGA